MVKIRAPNVHQVRHARSLLVVAAQVLLECHALEHFYALLQFDLLVGLPEELGISEARAQYPFVAMSNEPVRVAISVQHREKMWREFSTGIFDGEILLMVAHHGDEHFFRQREKLL